MTTYAVLGAGNGGQTLAAALTADGHQVRLWDVDEALMAALAKRRVIRTVGAMELEARPDALCSTVAEAVEPADVVFFVVPAHAHRSVAKELAPVLRADQIVVLNPGRTAGALDVRRTLEESGCADLPVVAETQSLLFTCRGGEPGVVEVLAVKCENRMACLPWDRSGEVEARLGGIYRGLVMADTTLATGLGNIGAILHPGPVLLNTGWIESRDRFFAHYYYGISPRIAAFLETMDAERLAVAAAYGVKLRSVKAWHEDVYGGRGEDLYATLQQNSSYASLDAPRSLGHRYMTEDLPTGLVPISELGRAAGVPTPFVDLIVDLARAITGIDHREQGRNLRSLGLAGKTIAEVGATFREG